MGTYFYNLPSTSSRRNKYISPPSDSLVLHDVSKLPLTDSFLYPSELFNCSIEAIVDICFLLAADKEAVPVTVWVVADFSSKSGVQLLKEALAYAVRTMLINVLNHAQ